MLDWHTRTDIKNSKYKQEA